VNFRANFLEWLLAAANEVHASAKLGKSQGHRPAEASSATRQEDRPAF
jgi:hypothetical protein